MNERELGIRRAEDEAKKLNKRFGVRSASHIKVLLYPPALGVKVVVGKLEGSLAMLSMGRKPTIRVSDRPCHPGDLAFSIAHELGHHLLRHTPARVGAACKRDRPYQPVARGTSRHAEAEANTVAAGVCLPSELLMDQIAAAPPSLDVANVIAKEYTMPLTATAIRVAELSPYACAAVYSEAGKIAWAVPSSSFPVKLARGKRLIVGSMAFEYAQTGKLDENARTLSGATWLDTDEEIVEHSTVAPGTNGVITLLVLPGRPRRT